MRITQCLARNGELPAARGSFGICCARWISNGSGRSLEGQHVGLKVNGRMRRGLDPLAEGSES